MTGQPSTRVRIPADVDKDDHVLGRLTARQVAILAVTGVALWLVFMATRAWLPTLVFLAVAAAAVGVAVALAFGRRDGVTLDRLAWSALKQATQPRRLVRTTDTSGSAGDTTHSRDAVQPPPRWVGAGGDDEALPGLLRLPATAIGRHGVVDLGADGAAVMLACSTVNFALATDAEQQSMVAGFGRWLNSLIEPVQVVVRTERVSLAPLIARLEDAAGGLPHLALEDAAREHAAFLTQTTARDLRARQVLLVLTDRGHDGDGAQDTVEGVTARLRRRSDDAVRALQACGITATVLDGDRVRHVLAAACDPYAPPLVGTSRSIVTRRKEPH